MCVQVKFIQFPVIDFGLAHNIVLLYDCVTYSVSCKEQLCFLVVSLSSGVEGEAARSRLAPVMMTPQLVVTWTGIILQWKTRFILVCNLSVSLHLPPWPLAECTAVDSLCGNHGMLRDCTKPPMLPSMEICGIGMLLLAT